MLINPMTSFTNAQIAMIARSQKRILWLLLIGLVVLFGGFALPAVPTVIGLLYLTILSIGLIAAWLIYRLATVMEEPGRWIYVVCAFIPYVSTVTMLILNVRATSALRKHGLRVGLMGVSRADIARLASPEAAPVPTDDERSS